MFQTGDYIVYGSRGVCRVDKIGPLDFSGHEKGKLYYTLLPYYVEGSIVYVPVEANSAIMRPIMTKEEALALIDEIPQIEELWINDERSRETAYKEAVKSCDNRELIRIIKTIYQRGKSRMAAGKRMTVADNKYFKMAEDNLYAELAVTLSMSRDEAKDFVTEHVKAVVQQK